ncbi:hypothetical protein C8F01DRAFT_1244254 [Mycena amicta]|nr:hypothetical protein C8F01DRAFT_1244254 [Mycena amicta]
MVDLDAGMAFPVVFNECLQELHRYNIYIPICFYTDKNLRLMNAQAATLPRICINPPEGSTQKIQVVDTNALLIKLGITEETMTRDQWKEVCINVVEFYREVAGLELPEHVRMRQHFGYLNQVKNSETIFPAIRAMDIKLQQQYNAVPFKFDIGTYQSEMLIARMETMTLAPAVASSSSSSNHPSSQTNPPTARGRGRGRDGAPFSGGSNRKALTVTCLRCAVMLWAFIEIDFQNTAFVLSSLSRVVLWGLCSQRWKL